MEYPGESSSMGSFDTLPSRAGPAGTVLNTDIKGFSHKIEDVIKHGRWSYPVNFLLLNTATALLATKAFSLLCGEQTPHNV